MFCNNIKTAFRYLFTHKFFTLINLIGLSSGLCVCFFAMRYVSFELSYDGFNENAERIYRVVTDVKTPTGINYESAPAAMGPALQAEFPEVKAAARIFLDDYILQKDQHNYGTVKLAYADSSLFSVFTLPVISGNPKTVFDEPFNMVLSETAAKKYFGTINCLGKTLTLNGNQPATITGVIQDIPFNSHFIPIFFFPYPR